MVNLNASISMQSLTKWQKHKMALGDTVTARVSEVVFCATIEWEQQKLKIFLRNLYSIYLTIYLLWWVSVFIIISEQGFHPAQDIPWFILFTSILFIFWVVKYKFSSDKKFIYHESISLINLTTHILTVFIFSILMIFFS